MVTVTTDPKGLENTRKRCVELGCLGPRAATITSPDRDQPITNPADIKIAVDIHVEELGCLIIARVGEHTREVLPGIWTLIDPYLDSTVGIGE